MLKLLNVKLGLALLITVAFSSAAKAVIIEGSFDGRMWEWQSTNMEVTSDVQFFSNENAFRSFTGEFWYDTALASEPVLSNDDAGEQAVYSGPHNWLHTSLSAYNGAKLDLTSSGRSPTATSSPKEKISVERYGDQDLMRFSYEDGSPYGGAESYRVGSFSLAPEYAFVSSLELIQEHSTNNQDVNVLGYIEFETKGVRNGVEYFGWMVAQIDNFSIRVREPVTVPEPSSLVLMLGALLFLFWRANILRIHPVQKF